MSYTLRVENMDSLQLLMECALVKYSSSYFAYTSDLIEIFVASGLAATVPSAYKSVLYSCTEIGAINLSTVEWPSCFHLHF